ncbi:MAG TPA: tyrosine-type recombinase/integrase [Drouetiella sp.]
MSADTIQNTEKPRVPKRSKNSDVRSREYLTSSEVEKLIKAAGKNERSGERDALAIRMAYRHGLRVGELVSLQWSQIDLKKATLHVKRSKHGDDSIQILKREELNALRKLKSLSPDSNYVFNGQRGPLSVDAIQLLVKNAGIAAGLDFPVHPHMLRHGTGYQLANEGVDTRTLQQYLGHKNIQHTVRYTKLADKRVKEAGRLI